MDKLNTRSPYYITINSENPPVVIPPTDPVQTIPVSCGETYSTGTDVGENLFEINTSEVGSVFLTITGNQVPIRFVADWNGVSTVDTKYIGASSYDPQLLLANIPQGDIATAAVSNKNTIITLNKTTATPTLVTLRAYAPLVNDDYEVTFTCPTAAVITVPCGAGSTYSGGPAFPQTDTIELGSATGVVTLSYDTFGLPDKYIVTFDGVVVIDTKYRGSSSNQTVLNTALAARGLPAETIQGVRKGTTTFQKTTATTTATVEVYAPNDGTKWEYVLSCPQ